MIFSKTVCVSLIGFCLIHLLVRYRLENTVGITSVVCVCIFFIMVLQLLRLIHRLLNGDIMNSERCKHISHRVIKVVCGLVLISIAMPILLISVVKAVALAGIKVTMNTKPSYE